MASLSFAQEVPAVRPPRAEATVPDSAAAKGKEDKRVFGVLPNYRTAEMNAAATPLAARQKFYIAYKDSFDYPLVGVSAILAGIYHAGDRHPQFGQGAAGYFRRFGTSFADQAAGNFLAEGLFPVLFKEDPRYFRMSSGTKSRRLKYAMSRTFVTRTDGGRIVPNFAEFAGTGGASALGLAYYSDNRNAADFLQNWAIQLATDTGSQILREFWPDIKRAISGRRHHNDEKSTGN
jgi:hypothetical protein